MSDKIANGHRGEVEIELGGRKMIMRPTFQAIAEIEQQTGIGLVPLVRRLSAQDIGLFDVAVVIAAGLKAAGEPASLEKVGPMVLEEGIMNVAKPVGDFLVHALRGGKPEGEAKAPETKTG